jgi:hypothetical protein
MTIINLDVVSILDKCSCFSYVVSVCNIQIAENCFFALCYYSVQLCILRKLSKWNMEAMRMLIVSGLNGSMLELEI